MPLGAARITLLAKSQVTAVAEVIRKKVGVSAVGNAQIDTAQSKFGGASLLLDGTGDYLDTSLNVTPSGTDQYTIEGWIRRAADSGDYEYYAQKGWPDASVSNRAWFWGVSNTDKAIFIYAAGGSAVIKQGTTSLSVGTWYHVAVSNDGTTTRLFVDGTQENSWTSASLNTGSNYNVRIGAHIDGSTSYANGHLDEFRISDTARYTANFTPSTAPFVNDDNTLLLLHMDGTDGSTVFEDDNGVRAPNGVNAIGGAQVDTAQSQFGGASAYFDGVDDYIRVYDPEDKFNFGTNDFTIEFWYKKNTTNVTEQLACNRTGYTTGNWYIQFDHTTDKIQWGVFGGTAQRSTSTYDDTNWHHLAITRDAGDFTLWIDGSNQGEYNGTTYVWGRTADPFIDFGRIITGYGNLWMDEIRVSDTARYTANFTPATTPFVNDSNTLLLLHMDGTDASTDFRDDNGLTRSAVGVTAIGNAQVDTAQSKFGGASALFDGTGDALKLGSNIDLNTNNVFTIEAWVRRNADTGTYENIISNNWPVSPVSSRGWYFAINNNDKLNFGWANGSTSYSTTSVGTTNLATGTWYHCAVVGDGTNFKLYLNGTLEDTDTQQNINAGGNVLVGCGSTDFGVSANNSPFNGHIEELRISNTARYTANFTPATEPFQNDANTLLLLHMDGTDGSTTFVDDNGTYTV